MPKWTPIKGHTGLYEYKTQKGTRYGARRTYTDAMGKRREWQTSGKLFWRDADRDLKQFESDLANGKVGPITNQNITVDQYHQQLVQRKLKLGDWRESTRRAQMNYYKGYVKPAFGNRKLTTITRSEYQAYLDGLAIKGLAASTIKTIDSIMKNIMNDAENQDVIDKNRLRGLKLGGKEARSKELSNDQIQKWLKQATEMLDEYEMTMVLVDTLGLRRGEVMGLRNESITITHDEVNNRDQAAIKIDLQRTPTTLTGGPLKTKSSYRTIWVFGSLVERLKFAMLTADNLRQRNHIQSDKHWLWLGENGNPFYPDYIGRLERAVSDECDIKVYPHLLRHYFATTTIAGEKPQIDVMHYLGHKNLQMTADYTRASKEASLNVYSGIDGFISSLTK
ncbi:tyrosine-type recombinase/integrase [Lacticaseibacillus daqingensis]|uniref:tyrosine-type recombinase/integrase n=1 Tax=Lacticaseibacillus daqingensis TaxID=2486014 RepID=UPI000F7A9D38|nr:site-specific integrase [Lacticaseibacillus daqingensis]